MHEIRVHFDNGDHIDTRINGSVDTIVNYYLDHFFPFLTESGKETTAKARCVEFLDDLIVHMCGKDFRLVRIYSLKDSYLKKNELLSKFRVTLEETRHLTVCTMKNKEDAAYIPGMFYPW